MAFLDSLKSTLRRRSKKSSSSKSAVEDTTDRGYYDITPPPGSKHTARDSGSFIYRSRHSGLDKRKEAELRETLRTVVATTQQAKEIYDAEHSEWERQVLQAREDREIDREKESEAREAGQASQNASSGTRGECG